MKKKLLLLSMLFMIAQGPCSAIRKPIMLTVCNDDATLHGNPDDRTMTDLSLYIDDHILYLPEEFSFDGSVTIELWGRKGMAYNGIATTTCSKELPSALVVNYNIVIIYNGTTYIGEICL